MAEVTNTIVYADPTNEPAHLMCADALEQLGYQSESGPWRNAYLMAALEAHDFMIDVTLPDVGEQHVLHNYGTATI